MAVELRTGKFATESQGLLLTPKSLLHFLNSPHGLTLPIGASSKLSLIQVDWPTTIEKPARLVFLHSPEKGKPGPCQESSGVYSLVRLDR